MLEYNEMKMDSIREEKFVFIEKIFIKYTI